MSCFIKKMYFFLIFPILPLSCDNLKGKDKSDINFLNVVVNGSSKWYFLLFEKNNIANNRGDTIFLTRENCFSIVSDGSRFDSLVVLNNNGVNLKDSIVLLGIREPSNNKILQFYYPSQEELIRIESEQNFKGLIQIRGLNELDSLLSLAGRSVDNK